MLTTQNITCRDIAALLSAHGVRRVVLSPGSRNAPLLLAIKADGRFKVAVAVDERTAAFMALGMAVASDEPVAIVCTSGTALYNYAPAIAEAYYRCVPLIVVSADRPRQWIGQADSQTLVQPGALDSVVKRSYSMMTACEPASDLRWFNCREINDAMLTALSAPKGPVHINLPISAPLNGLDDIDEPEVAAPIELMRPAELFPTPVVRALGCGLASPRRVMIVAGINPPDSMLRKAMLRLAAFPNIVVVSENVANLGSGPWVGNAELALSAIMAENAAEYLPDVVITFGGAIISGRLKAFLRRSSAEHWAVGRCESTVDTFQRLTRRIEAPASLFFRQLASAMQPHRRESDYAAKWCGLSQAVERYTMNYVKRQSWCDLKAFSEIIPAIGKNINLQLSNGMTVRYAQMFGHVRAHRVESNRGVSGIDGSTSTAIGAAIVTPGYTTLLVSGDMSAQYDIGALFSGCVPANFKMVVMANGGGQIFRNIDATRHNPVVEQCLAVPRPLDWSAVAKAAGFSCYEAANENQFSKAMGLLLADSSRPGMLVAHTSSAANAEILLTMYEQLKNITIA